MPLARVGRNVWLVVLWILSILSFHDQIASLIRLSLQSDKYSHVILIPLISVALIYVERKQIFRGSRYDLGLGSILALAAMAFNLVLHTGPRPQMAALSVWILDLLWVWFAIFVGVYGRTSFRAAMFPLFFLLLVVPLPETLLDNIILALQRGTAVITYLLLKLFGVPVFSQGFKFLLPGVEIEIAQECSGIRSTLALFITAILAGHLFLRSSWRRVVLGFAAIPIAIFKNAVRIVILSSLGVYVDRGFLFGRLHRQGGVLFALIALAILVPLLFILQQSEKRRPKLKQVATIPDHPVAAELV